MSSVGHGTQRAIKAAVYRPAQRRGGVRGGFELQAERAAQRHGRRALVQRPGGDLLEAECQRGGAVRRAVARSLPFGLAGDQPSRRAGIAQLQLQGVTTQAA